MQNSQIKTHHLIKQSVFPSYRRNNLSASCVWTDADYPFAVSVLCQSASRPWKRLPVSCLQLFDGHVCVTLCGLQRGMPQHLLHLTQVRSPSSIWVAALWRNACGLMSGTPASRARSCTTCAPYVDRSARPAIPKRTRRPTCHRIVRDGHVPANHARPCRLVRRMA